MNRKRRDRERLVHDLGEVLGREVEGATHGLRRFGWQSLSVYAAVTLVVSFALENLSIATGFPFGHYHYTSASLGLWVGSVPLTIGISYTTLGYVAWITASALLDGADGRLGDRANSARRLDVIALPVLAAALMTLFDLGNDSTQSTLHHSWIWEQGGGLFGVPWTNYVGWWFVTFLFNRHESVRRAEAVGREPLAQAAVLYLLLNLASIFAYVYAPPGTVVDATGAVWNTRALYETMMTLNLFGTILFGLFAFAKLARNDLTRYETSTQPTEGRVEAAA